MRPLHIIMPMAGEGSRFLKEGWRHSVYEQVGRRKLVHDTIRHGRFTIIVNRGFIAFIKQNKGTLYKLHPLLTIQYKIQ